jgi:transposase
LLAPTLSAGDIVIMDNLPAHKGAAVRQIIEATGAELRFLPPYSPDLNPIELVFPKLKGHLRKAAERTVGGLWDRIGKALDAFTPGMRQLLPPRWLRFMLTAKRSRPTSRAWRLPQLQGGGRLGRSRDLNSSCRATIRMRVRVASARDVPEGPDHCLT